MKLRQKLAVVLASAMVVTAVPVVTMAASTSYAQKILTVKKETGFNPQLVIDVKDSSTTTGQVIYLSIEGAKFDTSKYTKNAPIKVTRGTDTVDATVVENEDDSLGIKINEEMPSGKYTIDIHAKDATADEVKILVDGSLTKAVDDTTAVVARKSSAKATVTAKSAKKIDGTGLIADITIEEPFANVVAGKKITLTLENSDYEFITDGTVTFERGLSEKESVTAEVSTKDAQVITFTVPSGATATAAGRAVISGIEIDYTGKGAVPTGDIEVTVSGDNVTETTVVVAKVVEEGAKLTLVDEKAASVTAGQSKKVKVKLEETLAGSFTKDKVVELTLDNGYLVELPTTTFDYDMTAIYKDDDSTKEIIGFKFKVPASYSKQEIELNIQSELDDKGEITLTASGQRAIGEDVSVVVAEVTPSIEVKATSMIAKSGVKDQKGGTLVITETAKGNIKSGQTFQIQLKDGVTFSGKPEFEVTEGDLIIDKIEVDKTTKSILNVTVKRASKTASTLTIKNFAINSDRTIADGSYAVELKGDALGKGTVKVADFLKVGEKTSAVSAFTIGESYYLVDGVKVEMDAAPYIEDGRTMVPVKYVAAALGLDGKDIVWDQANKTVTVFADRTVQLKANSNVAVVNGAALTIDGKVVVKDGRTFVPVSQLGNLLGVTATWDAATKTATFKN